jgi:hypothetical protein
MPTLNPNLLQQLHDIHLPPALTLWPLAPGWYLAAMILLLGLAGTVWGGYSWWQKNKIKREALNLLKQYEKTYLSNVVDMNRDHHISAALNELLKRVALAYFPREQVAHLHGKNWLLFLNETSKNLNFLTQEDALLICPYQPNCKRDLYPLFDVCRQWIMQREKPCLS